MKELIREMRLLIFGEIIHFSLWFLPKDADETLRWFLKMPFQK